MINNLQGTLELRNGIRIPGFGYGCYKAHGSELRDALICALETGYLLVDTASFYENEDMVGAVLKEVKPARSSLFVVSKIWPSQFENPVRALDESLAKLGLDYLDAYLLHWPGLKEKARYKAWNALLAETEKGKIRVPGVSNFLEKHLEALEHEFGNMPFLNQIEIHPAFQETGLCNFCQKRGIGVMGWSPLGRAKALHNPVLADIGKVHCKTPAQIALRWQVQKNYIPLPKSVHPERVRENANIFDFTLTDEEMRLIHSLNLPDDKGQIGKSPDVFPAD